MGDVAGPDEVRRRQGLLGHREDRGGSAADRAEQADHRGVEDEVDGESDPRPDAEAVVGNEVVEERDRVSVAHRHPLGHSRGAGGEEDVRFGVRIGRCGGRGRRRGCRRVGVGDADDGEARVPVVPQDGIGRAAVGEDGVDPGEPADRQVAVGGERRVERYGGGSGAQDRQVAEAGGQAAGAEQADPPGADGEEALDRSDPGGELAVGDGAAVVFEGDRLRVAGARLVRSG